MRNSDEFFDDVNDVFGMDDDGYQTDTDPADDGDTAETSDTTEDVEDTEDPDTETGEDADGGEEDEEEHTSDSEEEPAEDGAEGDSGDTNADDSFTLKVNKEERKVSREEMIALAQKGADYDRVKDQNGRHQQTIADLQAKLDGMAAKQGVLDILENVAQQSGSTLEQMVDTLYVNFRKSSGVSEDAARAELKNARLEKELNSYKTQQTKQQEEKDDAEARAQRDLEEFGREYPDVTLTEDLVDKLLPDIQKGLSLSAAYRKYEKAQDDARIADLQRQIAAKNQNKKNRAKAVGSKRDSGAGQAPDLSDIFERELFK